MDFSELVARQRAYFESGATRGADFRLQALEKLRAALIRNEGAIFDALKADLNKAPMESYMCENGLVLEEIRFHQKHLRLSLIHIYDVVRRTFSVRKVTSSHSKDQTVIITEQDIDDERLKKAIHDIGYEVTSVRREPYEQKGGFFSFLHK